MLGGDGDGDGGGGHDGVIQRREEQREEQRDVSKEETPAQQRSDIGSSSVGSLDREKEKDDRSSTPAEHDVAATTEPQLASTGRTGRGETTCIVNAAIVPTSWHGRHNKEMNKPVVVDLELPVWTDDDVEPRLREGDRW